MRTIKKLLPFLLPVCLIIYSCTTEPDKTTIKKWKQEILTTEQNFANIAKEEGIYKAFITYAADDAVLMRNNELVIGKKNIDLLYKEQASKGLAWTPDFVDVASSGDLGYTYGHYTYTYTDSTGTAIENKCVFHTVWKRQTDGLWKFVWD